MITVVISGDKCANGGDGWVPTSQSTGMEETGLRTGETDRDGLRWILLNMSLHEIEMNMNLQFI